MPEHSGQFCSYSVSFLHYDKKLHRSASADVKVNVVCFPGLGHVSLNLPFTVARYKIQMFLCNFQLCETLGGFWQVPSMQERSLFSNSQMQLKPSIKEVRLLAC